MIARYDVMKTHPMSSSLSCVSVSEGRGLSRTLYLSVAVILHSSETSAIVGDVSDEVIAMNSL